MAYSFRSGTVWRFKTKRFEVALHVEREHRYKYDGDDPDGETQSKLDKGEYVAFTSHVTVKLDGEVIGEDFLGGSVYGVDTANEFWTAHRDPDPMNRNCTIMRKARGGSEDARYSIGHYFPDMVKEAISNARITISDMKPVPYIRGDDVHGVRP